MTAIIWNQKSAWAKTVSSYMKKLEARHEFLHLDIITAKNENTAAEIFAAVEMSLWWILHAKIQQSTMLNYKLCFFFFFDCTWDCTVSFCRIQHFLYYLNILNVSVFLLFFKSFCLLFWLKLLLNKIIPQAPSVG